MELENIDKWNDDKGDEVLRLTYDLDENSCVFDVGGYEGNWTHDIVELYKCNAWIFEPVTAFHDNIEERFKDNNKIKCFKFGFSNENKIRDIIIDDDSSSIYTLGPADAEKKVEVVKFIKISEFINEQFLTEHSYIDLIKINIEGGEYEILEELIATQLINKVRNVQVQFHDFCDNAKKRRKNIQDALSKTHEQTYNYDWIWENWKLK